jgi:hypothetical protein
MTVNLPEPLQEAVEAQPDAPIRYVDPRTKAEYVLIRADVYDRMGKIVGIDPGDAYPLVDETFREGWSGPKMAEYDDYESRKTA